MLGVLVRALRRYGSPDALYLDNGATYRGAVLRTACERPGITLLHARPGDAPARGKMERFWRTLREGCLDFLGPVTSLHAVQVRLLGFLDQHYHVAPHAGLFGRSPQSAWTAALAERPADLLTEDQLRTALTVRERRRVRRDTTVAVGGQDWELDQGFLAGRLSGRLVEPLVVASGGPAGRIWTGELRRPRSRATSHASMRTDAGLLALLVVTFTARTRAQDQPAPPPGATQPTEQPAAGVTPPRLSHVDGDVSYWRPGAEDWTPARVNTPLAPGDSLYAGSGANLEVQVGPRAFVRGGTDTEIGLDNNERDFQQFKITSGQVSLDLRQLGTGQTVEVDTPQAAFTVDRPGYYRANVDENSTAFITRRGGTATVTSAGGEAMDVRPSEEIVLTGTDNPQMASYVAPDLDAWDRWNYDRTDHLLDAVSDRYVPQGVYGADDLDHYGNWRTVPQYGEVWVPDRVAPDWAPYSTGRWIWDPVYGWTWVDDAPWGWAPYHYGRWAYMDGFWGWAPGPLVVRPAYAPALVAWFGAPELSIGVNIGGPALGWCALGWGEPVIPWWGGAGFVGVPWWGGWGGPQIVNNEVVERNTVVNVKNITVYQNATVHNAVVAVGRDEFGRGAPKHVRLSAAQAQQMKPLEGPISERPTAASPVPAAGHARRPPERIHSRQVVATRAPKVATPVERGGGKPAAAAAPAAPRIVRAPARPRPEETQRRPPSAPDAGALERPRPPPPPHYAMYRQGPPGGGRGPVPRAPVPTEAPRVALPSERPPRTEAARPRREAVTPRPPTYPSAPATGPQAGRPLPPRAIASAPAPPRREHALPGEPANRLRPLAGFRPPPPPHPAEGRGDRRPPR